MDLSCNELYHTTYFASELLALVYARSSWWKQHRDDGKISDKDVPVSMDRVTLVPDRNLDGRLLVSFRTFTAFVKSLCRLRFCLTKSSNFIT